jgi:hypothetical protein
MGKQRKPEKFKRIRKLKIAGHEFKIIWKDLRTEGVYGYVDPDERAIYICTVSNPTRRLARSTLLHEAIHAILELTGIQHLEGFGNLEEALVRVIDYHLIPLFDDVDKRMGDQ